jgi:hypothetical protein
MRGFLSIIFLLLVFPNSNRPLKSQSLQLHRSQLKARFITKAREASRIFLIQDRHKTDDTILTLITFEWLNHSAANVALNKLTFVIPLYPKKPGPLRY